MTDQVLNNSSEPHVVAGAYELSELVTLINDEITASLRVQGDDSFLVEKSGEREDIGRYICIEQAGNQLAIPLSGVLEAGELQVVQSLPLLPEWITGITNIRGEIVSVVNLDLFLGRHNKSSADARSFLIVHDDSLKIAITVDRVVGTHSLYNPKIEQSEQGPDSYQSAEFFAVRAVYDEHDGEK